MGNSVKLYSNGTAVINQEYVMDGKPIEVSIPVNKQDLDEVVASITVYGNVEVPEPPSYTPINANPTRLEFDINNVTKSLATKLAGAKVEVGAGNSSIKGKLMGIQTYQQETNGSVFDRFRVVVLTDQGVRAFEDKEVSYISFTESTIQLELEKALQKKYESIKPDSSFVSIKIVPQQGAELAMVSYAVPCAAWKIRYQLRTVNGKVEIEGQAVVDNDTEDDWRDSIISVVTGEPIAFSTDLAEIRRPQRQRINVVSDEAQGAVRVDEAKSIHRRGAHGVMRTMGVMGSAEAECIGSTVNGGTAVCDDALENYQTAKVQQSEISESGDFSIFTTPKPVTVLSKKSAIIPMFRSSVVNSQIVLFYKEENDHRRPFRSIKLKNENNHTLGKGICEVFLDGDFQGKCVLEPCKPGEDVILVYAKETGVKVFKESSPVEDRRISIRFNNGRIITEESYLQKTVYSVENVKDEEFRFEAEYRRTWQESSIKTSENCEVIDTVNGVRLGCVLAAKGQQTLEVAETYVRSFEFAANSLWLERQILNIKHPLSKNKGVKQCVELQKKIEDLQEIVTANAEQIDFIKREQERINKLIPNASVEQQRTWQVNMTENENELRRLGREENPRIKKEISALQKLLNETLFALSVTWTEDGRE